MEKSETLLLRLSKRHKKELKRRAKLVGCSMSSLARSAIFSNRDTHIKEFMSLTINRGQLNGSAIMAARRLLRNVRAFEGNVSPEVYHDMEETCLKVIERCTALKRQLRDDITEFRREIGLPQISRPQHKIRTLEEANLDYWNEVAREEGLEEIHVEDIADGTVDNTKDEIDDMLDFLSDLGEEPEVFTSFDEEIGSEEEIDYVEDGAIGESPAEEDSTMGSTGAEDTFTEDPSTEDSSTEGLFTENPSTENPARESGGEEGNEEEEDNEEEESARDSPGSTERRDRFEHIRRRWDMLGD